MEKPNFDRLLQRYLTGNVTEQERIEIEAWLEILKTKDTTDLELSKEAQDELFLKITSNLGIEPKSLPMGRELVQTDRQTHWHHYIRVAASIILILSASILIFRFLAKAPPSPIAGNQIEKMILNDGSVVWLRGQSKLVYYEKPSENIRYAELTGEALFEIAKDPRHPFMIKCGDVKVRVLGTSFSLKVDSSGLELKVLTGKVNLSSEKTTATIDVDPYQKVFYAGGEEMKKLPFSSKEFDDLTANTEYKMTFTNTTLSEVIAGIERKFDVTIVLANDSAGKCRVTADFTDQSLQTVLQMITEVLDVAVTRDGNKISITGKGCE